MTAIEKLLQTAFAEEGYLEKRSNAELDSKTANAGQNNWTKYWRDLRPDFQGQPWCDCFVGWVFMKAFGEQVGNEMLCGGLRSFYTPTSANYFNAKGRLGSVPQPGDQVFFTKNGYASGAYHTGIVYAAEGGYVKTIEGNTSGASGVVDNGGGVAKKSYSLAAYAGKMLFGHPDFSLWKEETPNTANKKGEAKKQIWEVVKMPKLKSNMIGSAVRAWQAIIGCEVTGVFDLPTEKATVKWKKAHGLDDKPVVGDAAWRIGLDGLKAK